jgi:hypothetical protein
MSGQSPIIGQLKASVNSGSRLITVDSGEAVGLIDADVGVLKISTESGGTGSADFVADDATAPFKFGPGTADTSIGVEVATTCDGLNPDAGRFIVDDGGLPVWNVGSERRRK